VLFHRLVPDFPALPIIGDAHALLPSRVKPFGPLLGCCRPTAERLIEFLRDVFHMLLVVVLRNLDAGWCSRRLQSVCRYIVLVVCEEREWEGGSQRRGCRKQKARVLTRQSRPMNRVGATYCLALLEQTRPARYDGEGPDYSHACVARSLLPYTLARGIRINFITELASLGPSQLPHVQLSEARERLRGLVTHSIAGRGPQRFRL
jgi:hypothetical protein